MFAPTAEQQTALELFATGEDLVIQAGAGTGKTSTLELLAKSTTRRGQYLAFNRAIVEESRSKFPSNVTCSTAHSLAYRAIAAGTPYEDRMRSGKRMRSIDIANLLGIDGIKVTTSEGDVRMLSSSFLAGLTLSTITRFCQSADDAPTRRHVPNVPGLDHEGDRTINRIVAKHVEPYAVKAWKDLTKHEGRLPFTRSIAMSVFLKLWQLSGPRIGADFILFDEAQDANPVMVAIVAAQTHCQLVWVGDSQQQIYAFTGAINALDNLPNANVAYLTQSFRFGPAVADVANHVLGLIESAKLRLVGFDKIASVVAPVAEPNAILTRTNAAAVRTVLEALREEKKVHLVGGGSDVVAFCKAALALQNGDRTDHPELAPFESWGEVQSYVEEDEQGGDLKLLVKLIDEFTAAAIISALGDQSKEEDAELVVSTAHKSKGRQWGSVQLAGDFQEDTIVKSDDEKRLLYVAVTRAQFELDIEAIPFLRDRYVPTVTADPVVATTAAKTTATVETVAAPSNEHIGTVGEKLELALTVERVGDAPAKFGGWFTILSDSDGNMVKWFADERYEPGTKLSGSFTVKAHDEFNGKNQTHVNRPAGVTVAS